MSADVGERRTMSQARVIRRSTALLALSMSARHAIAVVKRQSLSGQIDLARCVMCRVGAETDQPNPATLTG